MPTSLVGKKLDSSITDFNRRFPIPYDHVFLGNNGNATHPILFTPIMQSGWDPGFHAYDVYTWFPESVRFFNTTRPYTELGYFLGGRSEQVIDITHTQNVKPNWNILFQYRVVNSPGFYKNQNTNHNNYLLNSRYQSRNKRYTNYFTLLANSMQSSENGGLSDSADYLNDPIYNDRFNIPTKLGGDVEFSRNVFSTKLYTGHRYREFNVILRQLYDLGQKDSIISDSTVIPLFYPRIRFEHEIQYSRFEFKYIDLPNFEASVPYYPDSLYYDYHYDYPLLDDSLIVREKWKEFVNQFSIYTFPDAKNQLQYLKAGIAIQNLKLESFTNSASLYNLFLIGEYRNSTRDKKWDMELGGRFYINGLNAGDYQVDAVLKRFLSKNGSFVNFEFHNVNREPSFVFDKRSTYYWDTPKSFNKENITELSASNFWLKRNLQVTANYFLVKNYAYFTDYYKAQQENALFNLLQLTASKKFQLGKRWVWHCDVYFQQKIGNAPVNVPALFTRNLIGYEGKLGFKSLNFASGFEIKYHTPYDADNYSPVQGSFFYQDSVKIYNRPDIAYYVNFRIRNFTAYIRVENLNTLTPIQGGWGFRHQNFAAEDYPYPGVNMRGGIYWSFVN